jgi:two-component sensor histidine kinase
VTFKEGGVSMTYLLYVWKLLVRNTGTIAVTLGNMMVFFCFLRPRWKSWLYPALVAITYLSLPLMWSLYTGLFGTSNNHSLFLALLGYLNDILVLIAFREGFFQTITLIFALSILNRMFIFWGYILYIPLNSAVYRNMDIGISVTLVLVVIYSIVSLVCWLYLKEKCRKLIQTQLLRYNWRVLAGIAVFAKLIIDFCSNHAFGLNPYSDTQIIWAMIALSTFVVAVLGLYLYSTVTTLNQSELKAAASRLTFEKEAQQRYYEALLHNQEELHRMKHDMNGHLNTVSQLLADDKKEAAMQYLSNLSEYAENHQKKLYSEDPYINAVVTNYTGIFAAKDITFEYDIKPVSLQLNQVEICLALNNAFQNAVEASLKLPVEKRYIKLKIKEKQNRFLFRVTNSFVGNLILKDGLPVSTKGDQGHGYGLTSIRSAAESLGGFVVCKSDGDMFVLDVAM